MSYGMEWDYARGYFYITPNCVLHIQKDMPKHIKERFIPEILAHQQEVVERRKNFIIQSDDMYFEKIVYDE